MSIEASIKLLYYLLVAWYAIFLAGTIQFRKIKSKTEGIILRHAENLLKNNAEIEPEKVYAYCYAEWCEMVKKSAWFIPGKYELGPILATLKNVKKRIGFSPVYIGEMLKKRNLL
jgi:hypothetical protein